MLLLFSGTLHEDYLRELLTTLGDRFSQEDVDDLYKVRFFYIIQYYFYKKFNNFLNIFF